MFGKKTQVLHGFDLNVADGSFTILLGPSSCVKFTLLQITAGLERTDAGRVIIGSEDITRLKPQERDLAMVFQNYALYPHMNIRKNIEYGLKAKKIPKEERNRQIESVVISLGTHIVLLNGGRIMQQTPPRDLHQPPVALCRAVHRLAPRKRPGLRRLLGHHPTGGALLPALARETDDSPRAGGLPGASRRRDALLSANGAWPGHRF